MKANLMRTSQLVSCCCCVFFLNVLIQCLSYHVAIEGDGYGTRNVSSSKKESFAIVNNEFSIINSHFSCHVYHVGLY